MLGTLPETVRSDELSLRLVRRDDADAVFDALSNWDVAKMLGMPPWPYTRADALEFIEKVTARDPFGDVWTRAIAEPEGDRLIGAIGGAVQETGEPTLGYWLAKPYWGKGYMSKALGLVLGRLFAEKPDAVVLSAVLADNPASLRVQRKLGFEVVDEGTAYCRPRDAEVADYKTQLTRAQFESATQ